ncbi:MAG: hypothetical protein IBX41_00525 [Methanophagales archaeon]|nr:hypothetical protein [Methanophagales archaeon]
MIPDWAKSLLVKIALGTVILFALLIFTGNAGASDVIVNPSLIDVSFAFNQPIGSRDYSTDEYFTITISGNDTITIDSVSDDNDRIRITPLPSSFSLEDGESKSIKITIWASSYASEGKHVEEVKIRSNGEIKEIVKVTVTIIYYAKIEVSPSSIDFGRVGRKESPSRTVEIREVLGYKSASGVSILPRISGNNWVEPDKYGDIGSVSHSHPYSLTFQMKSEKHPDYNRYSWEYKITSNNAGSATIPIEAYILMPPKLGTLYDEYLEIKFDKPKGTVPKYDRYIEVRVRNDGDEILSFTSKFTESPSGITIRIVNPSGSVSGKSSETISLHVVAPYDAPEGTYRGRLRIDATDKDGKYNAGRGSVDITIEIIWPVDFTISPTSIDFGSLELKERGYEEKSENITLTEFYHYKPVRNLRISKSGEYGNWLREEWDFAEIPPGASRTITLKIEPGLEAVPQDYLWRYALSASGIGAKRMEVKAKIVPLNITKMIEDFKSFRETPLYRNYPSSESIISDGIGILEIIAGSEVSAEDWQKIPVLMKGTLSLLSSLNGGIVSSEEENYGKTVESLSAASVSTSTIESNSNLNNRDISGYATDMSASADQTTEEVLLDAAKLLELRGWTIKKAVEHALAMNDISGLKNEENVLESAISYQYAAMLYGLLNNREKRLGSVHEGSLLMDKHDELVSDAAELRIKADNALSNSKENDLIRIGDLHLLLNPYDYDTFLESYKMAERYLEEATKKYKVSGELLLADKTEEDLTNLKGERRFILSLFFIACSVYGVLFISALVRIIGGSMAYMRDMYEREVGDLLVT